MEKVKKYHVNNSIEMAAFIKLLLNKMLEQHKITVQDILGSEKKILNEHGVEWYQHYTFGKESEYTKWKEFCIDAMRTKLIPKFSKKKAEREFSNLDLVYGLKCNFQTI